MSRHLDKVLAHAERELAPAGARRPTEVLSLYKKFLNIEEHRLRLQHQAGGGGREICALRVELVDVLLRRVFSAAAAFAQQEHQVATPLTLIALGGYGRGELNPFSDVDVMFLHDGSASAVPPYVTFVVEQVLYLLWDIGFKVGHSTRSVDEAIQQANGDMLTKTAMLESRHLAGDPNVTRRFREQFRIHCVEGQHAAYVALRIQDQARQHAKFGDSVYMQEPNVKSGCGGLRDYQNLLWITFFDEGSLTATNLVDKDWLSEADRKRIESAYDFLLRVRTDMHYLNGRATDILYTNFQQQLALRLGYSRQHPVARSEAFMKDYYEHTRNIFRVTERITEQFARGRSLPGGTAFFCLVPQPGEDDEEIGQFIIRGGQLYNRQPDLFSTDPESMMRAFQIVQERNCDLSPQLADLISRNLGLITRTFQYAKGPREIFASILSRKGEVGRVLRIMHRIDFLGRYMPEFGPLTCLVQHEFFHRYTADEHTLVCIDKLDEILSTDDPKLRSYRALFEHLEDPAVLYLALLLHDTGRAVGARPHSEASAVFAQRAALRLQLSPGRRRILIRLVDHHVSLSNMAQHRNIDDPDTAVEFAQSVTDQKTLDALMLLTLADGRGTSADAWSDWKETLVWQLYRATSRYLADQKGFYEQTRIERASVQSAVTSLLSDDYADEIDAHFEHMPDNYFRAFKVSEIASHLKAFRRFLANLYNNDEPPLVPAVTWNDVIEQGHTTAAFCTWDHHQLLARIAGSFAVVPLNILSADIYTRGDSVVLDVFRVCDLNRRAVTNTADREMVEKTLRKALTRENFSFAPALERARQKVSKIGFRRMDFSTHISVDNKTHRSQTIVQLKTADRIGLLYELLCAFDAERISIALARISTEKGAATDTFYVVDHETRGKITADERIAALQKRLHAAAVGP